MLFKCCAVGAVRHANVFAAARIPLLHQDTHTCGIVKKRRERRVLDGILKE